MSRKTIAAGAAAALAVAVGAAAATVPAQASVAPRLGTTSLATVLTSDGNTFDSDGKDFDVVTEAALAVLTAKPDSPVAVLTKGGKRVTAFVPNDRAFKQLASALTGTTIRSERKAFNTVAGLGIDSVERVLLSHVVVGATITAKQALASDGAVLTTASGAKITVKVRGAHTDRPSVWIHDRSKTTSDAKVVVPDVNKGNRQIAHGINAVLLPATV